jgi:hypothetical protein
MNRTPEREIALSNACGHHAMQMLAIKESLDPHSVAATVDVLVGRGPEVCRFTDLALAQLEGIDRPGIDSVVSDRLIPELVAAAWHQLQQEVSA